MTINEAIKNVDTLLPNVYSDDDKIRWLSTVDGLIYNNIIKRCHGAPEYSGYNSDTPAETELLVGGPYTDIYLHWLESKIYFYNGEYGKYNNAVMEYNSMYKAFGAEYNSTHMPITRREARYF